MPAKSLSKLLAATFLLMALVCTGTAAAAIPAGNTGWFWANPLPQGNTLDRLEVSGGRIWAGGATGTMMRPKSSAPCCGIREAIPMLIVTTMSVPCTENGWRKC